MKAQLRNLFTSVFSMERQERLKVWFMSLAFFLIVGAYTIAKELKDSIFVSIVGRTWLPEVKIYSIFVLVPFILLYSRAVDKMRRYELVAFYSGIFGVISLLFTYLIGHPTIGIGNTQASPHRVFGWIFYFFVEGFSPFLVSVFWAFLNSVSKPEEAKKTYPWIIAGSKLGGMTTSGFAWILFRFAGEGIKAHLSEAVSHQILMGITAILLLLVPVVIYTMMHRVSGYHLHGYEAVYKLEKKRAKEQEEEASRGSVFTAIRDQLSGMFGGLVMFVKQPYILGIFSLTFFFEVINAIFNYQRLGIVQSQAVSISGVSSILYAQRFSVHFLGLVITLLGTQLLLNKLGERLCLILIPLISGSLMFYLILSPNPQAVFIAFIGLQALNYSFAHPIKESLYIPTVKELKFKSKSWIDAFGSKLSKMTGSAFNILGDKVGPAFFMPLHVGVFIVLIGAWLFSAGWLGRRYERAIENNEVINSVS
ncbi:hypothetical protein JW872_02080 [Candidatus Babeliales bacterium]|nr:hypothetical protein [Candidatus Babeliales bacterium]